MPLVLTDYQVWRKTANVTTGGNAGLVEIDCDPVPQGSVWRVDQVACVVFPLGQGESIVVSNPILVSLYDAAQPGPTAIPIQATELAPYPSPYGNVSATEPSYWADWDAEAGPFTILGGQQLAIVFSPIPQGSTAAVRVQYGLFMGTAGTPTPVAGAQPNPVSPGI